MTLKFNATIIGCMIAGAASAGYLRSEGWRATSPATSPLAAISPETLSPAEALPPLFLQAATETPASASWPPDGSVAFYEETFALLTTAATQPASRAATTPVATNDPEPETPAVRQQTASIADPAPETRPLRDGNVGAVDQPAPSRAGEPRPPRAGGPPPRTNDTVEVVIRDRFGRPIRVERVERRRFAAPHGYPPPPPHHRLHGAYGPYGPYAPPYGAYGPYGRYGH